MTDENVPAGEAAGDTATPVTPAFTVLTPGATDEEIAALTAVIASLGGEEAPEAPKRRVWGSPQRAIRTISPAGAGGWEASRLP